MHVGVLWRLSVLRCKMNTIFSIAPSAQSKINIGNYFVIDIIIDC